MIVNLTFINKGFEGLISILLKSAFQSGKREVTVRSAVFQEYLAHLMEGKKEVPHVGPSGFDACVN